MSKTTVLPTLVVLLLAGVTLVAASPEASSEPSFGFEMDIAPLADTPDGYRCQAIFRDLRTDDVIAAPQVAFLRGSDAEAQTEIPGTGQVAALSVKVSEEGILTYELEVRAGQKLVSRHKATVALEG